MSQPLTVNPTMSAGQWSLLIVLSILWGGSFFFIAIAVRQLPPITIVALRVLLAAMALLVVTRIMGIALPRQRRVWRAFFGMSLINNVLPFTLLVWAQSHIASGVASILNATTPLFTVVVAHYLTQDEKLTQGRIVGVLLGIAGVSVMIGVTALQSFGVDIVAEGACLLAAVCYALSAVYGRRFKRLGVAPLATVTGMVCASSLILVPLALIVDRPWTLPWPGTAAIASVTGLALISTAFAYIIYFRLLAAAGSTNLTLVTFLVPISAMALGIAFLGETLQSRQIAGSMLIGLGIVAIDGRVWARLCGRSRPDASPRPAAKAEIRDP
jgi:drug/metabolite transporter (DMT)-like permease